MIETSKRAEAATSSKNWRHGITDENGITNETRSFLQRKAEDLGIPQTKDKIMLSAQAALLGVVWLGSKVVDVTLGNVVRSGLFIGSAIAYALDPKKIQKKEIFWDPNPPAINYGAGSVTTETIHPIDRMRARLKKLRGLFNGRRYYEVTSERQPDGTRLKRTK